jgi:hypothetical protein
VYRFEWNTEEHLLSVILLDVFALLLTVFVLQIDHFWARAAGGFCRELWVRSFGVWASSCAVDTPAIVYAGFFRAQRGRRSRVGTVMGGTRTLMD